MTTIKIPVKELEYPDNGDWEFASTYENGKLRIMVF
jgi:hypothetical protein